MVQPTTVKLEVSARYDTPLPKSQVHLWGTIPSIRRSFPSNGRVRIPLPANQPFVPLRRTWPPAEPILKEVERLEGYVRTIEDNWAAVTLKTAQGHRLEVWFPLARLQREGLAHPGAAFQYIVKIYGESVRSEIVPVEIPEDAPWLVRIREFDVSAIADYLAKQSAADG